MVERLVCLILNPLVQSFNRGLATSCVVSLGGEVIRLLKRGGRGSFGQCKNYYYFNLTDKQG